MTNFTISAKIYNLEHTASWRFHLFMYIFLYILTVMRKLYSTIYYKTAVQTPRQNDFFSLWKRAFGRMKIIGIQSEHELNFRIKRNCPQNLITLPSFIKTLQ